MRSGVDDLVTIIDWLSATKTPPHNVAAAMERLRRRAQRNVPLDIKMYDDGQTTEDTQDEYIGHKG